MQTTNGERRNTILVSAFAAILIALAASVLTAKLLPRSEAALGTSQSVYPEIRSRGSIRAGYYVGAPYLLVDLKTGQKSGIFYDVMESAAAKLGLKVEWVEEVGFGEMQESLRSRRLDIIGSGIWISPDRAKGAGFTIPILFDAVFPYVRADDTRFDAAPNSINQPSVTISTIDGEMAATIAAADYPRAKTLSLPQSTDFTQMILNVVSKRADLTFLALGPAENYSRVHPGQLRNLTPHQPARVFPAAIMIPQGDYTFATALNLTLSEMLNSGEIDSIIAKYEETPGVHLRVAKPFIRLKADTAQ